MDAANPAEQFLHEEVPPDLRPLIPSALRRAYATADEVMERYPFLDTPGGKYQRGDLIALAADYEFERLIKTNSLPFEPRWEYYARPTGKHFVMLTKRAHITISQVEDPALKPRTAAYRDKFGVPNARFLFEEMNQEVERDMGRRLIHILHGYQSLTFAHLTLPHPDRNKHVWRSGNLMNVPHAVFTDDLPKAEGPAESPNPEALEKLERFLHDEDD